MERDFKFEKWQSIRPFPNQALKDLSTNVYDEAENFALSVSRVDRLSNIIQQSFANGGLYAQDCLMAHHLAYGIDNPPPKPEDPDFRINLDTYTVLLAKLHRKEIDVPPWCTGFGWSGDLPFRGIQSRLSDQIETLMLTQVVSVWTAFETLAGDLWEAALNAHPQGLSDLRGNRTRKSNDISDTRAEDDEIPDVSTAPDRQQGDQYDGDENDDDEETVATLPIPRRLLQRRGYDLRDKMGTALKHEFRFISLGGIRRAYNTDLI
jgi:hypothetical protein